MTSCFDIGCSFGLDDTVFLPDRVNGGWDIGQVRIGCPFGAGVRLDLIEHCPDLLAEWREAAAQESFRDEMEIGRPEQSGEARDRYDRGMAALARHHEISDCEMTVYAIGVAHLRITFADGLDLPVLKGLMRTFAYGAFHPGIARNFQSKATRFVISNLSSPPSPLVDLSCRKLPSAVTDEKGYSELALLENFQPTVALIDGADADKVDYVLEAFDTSPSQVTAFDFRYHGRIWHSEEVTVFETRSLRSGVYDPEEASPAIERLEACHQIARVMRTSARSFERLLEQESDRQVLSYSDSSIETRTPFELNGLRALALAVVSRTKSQAVTSVSEDCRYLDFYDENHGTTLARDHITSACEVVYSVQQAETQDRSDRRQALLNGIVLLLTAVTLLSVSSDAYDFVRNNETLVGGTELRALLLLNFSIALCLGLAGVTLLIRRMTQRKHRANRELTDVGDGFASPHG